MDPVPVLVKILHLIPALCLLVEKVKYHKKNCQTLAACIKLLKPVVDIVEESKVPLSAAAIESFETIECGLVSAKELLEWCGGKYSRFYLALRTELFVKKFQDISLEIESCLRSLPLEIPQLSNERQEEVEISLEAFGKAKYCANSEEEKMAEEAIFALKDIQKGVKISHDKLTSLAGRFDLVSNQEILREASLLEKEKNHVRIEKDKLEEEFINQLISLATQISDDLAEQKHAQAELGGLPYPADFRCPLSLELMSDPVIVASGQTYEKAYIQQWLEQGNTTCPKTRQPLSHRNLIPNYTVKALIANWCEANNVPLPEPAKLDNSGLQLTPASSFLSAKSELDDQTYTQEVATLQKSSTGETVAAVGSRLTGRSVRTIRHRVHDDQELDRRSGLVFGTGEVTRESSRVNSRSVTVGDSNGRRQAMALGNGDPGLDHLHGHSRNTSSSSVVSSIDELQTATVSDEASFEAPHSISDSYRYGSDTSGELERSSTLTDVPTHQEQISSPARAPDGVAVYWRRRRDGRDLNTPRIVPSAVPVAAAVDGNIQSQIETLVEDIQSDSINLQRSGAAGLRLLAKHNMENRIVIANCGAIRPLVTLLHSTDLITQENAVTALLNLSINDNNKNEIAAAGAIDPLVDVLREGNSDAKENAAATLYSLSVMDENKATIGQSGAIRPLVELLMQGRSRGKKDAATALFNLSIFHENKARIVQAGAIRPLVELMSDPAAGMVDKAVAVLANLATISEGRSAIGEEGGIVTLVEVVEMGSQRGKENAAAALLQLCSNSSRFRALVLQEGAIPPLVALVQSGTPRAKEKASSLLRLFREQRHGSHGRGVPDRHMDRHIDRP